jgi:hypothetical protein
MMGAGATNKVVAPYQIFAITAKIPYRIIRYDPPSHLLIPARDVKIAKTTPMTIIPSASRKLGISSYPMRLHMYPCRSDPMSAGTFMEPF